MRAFHTLSAGNGGQPPIVGPPDCPQAGPPARTPVSPAVTMSHSAALRATPRPVNPVVSLRMADLPVAIAASGEPRARVVLSGDGGAAIGGDSEGMGSSA